MKQLRGGKTAAAGLRDGWASTNCAGFAWGCEIAMKAILKSKKPCNSAKKAVLLAISGYSPCPVCTRDRVGTDAGDVCAHGPVFFTWSFSMPQAEFSCSSRTVMSLKSFLNLGAIGLRTVSTAAAAKWFEVGPLRTKFGGLRQGFSRLVSTNSILTSVIILDSIL